MAQSQYNPDVFPRLDIAREDRPGPAYIDLVTVHGILDRDPNQTWTWTARGFGTSPAPGLDASTHNSPVPGTAPAHVAWLTDDDMLPSVVSHLRVLQFKYNVSQSASREGLKLHLERTSLALRNLLQERVLSVSSRPIIFVAHGYGGLVVLKTLVDGIVSARTIGVLCLGTPFRPVSVENHIADALPGYATMLTDEFDTLPDLLADFRSAHGTREVPIRCFYETEPVHGKGVIVPKQAAVLDDLNAMSFALDDVDHYSMNKYQSAADHNYELVCDVLLGVVDNAYAAVLTQAILSFDEIRAREIIRANRNSFATNDRCATALSAAVTLGLEKIVKLLLDANVRVNASLNENKDTALIQAVRSTNGTRIRIVRQLLEKGADVSALNGENKSAIDYAKESNDDALTKLLENRPLIVGPPVRKPTLPRDRIAAPQLATVDFDCTKYITATVADVFEIGGNEKTFRRTPSVNDLIYEHGPRHLMNRAILRELEQGVKKYRWLHLPANNLTWMKDLIRRTYKERIPDENFSEAYYLQKFLSITDSSHWEELVVTSPIADLSHIRYLFPRCRTLPYIKPDTPDLPTGDVIIFMPFLHYEHTSQRQSMAATIEEVSEGVRTAPPRPTMNTPDQNSIWAYLRGDTPLHVRRTLDQFYYDSLNSDVQQKKGVPPRNLDQVTQRFMRDQEQWKSDDPLLLMVDQLWMVMLEDDTLITSFPQRWGMTDLHNVNVVKEADIAGSIAEELSNKDRPLLTSPYDMMFLVIDLCTSILFDAGVHRNEKLRFFEFFERKIQQVTNQESEMFGYLKNQLEQLSKRNKARDQDKTLMKLLDELLDITDEVKMLNEIKDVHDELEMILHVFDTQLEVLQQMNTLLTYRQRPVAPHILKKWSKIMDKIERRREKVQAMDHNAHRTYKSINNLFDMKQRQANVLEAHYSRKVAQDSGRQATTIMIFTTVSVIFLPLSFMSSFYALSIKEFPRDPSNQNQLYMPLSYVVLRVIGTGLAIAALLVLLAFGLNHLINRYPNMSPFAPREPSTTTSDSSTSSVSHGISMTPLRTSKGPLALAASLASQNIVRQRKQVEPYGSSIFSFDSYSPSPVKKDTSTSSRSSALAGLFWPKSPSPIGLQGDGVADDEGREREKGGVRSWDVPERFGRKRWGWRPGGGKDGRVFTAPA